MGKLFDFIKKYFHVLLFIILQVVCIVMISHSMTYQHYYIAHATNAITAPVNKLSYNIISHFNLNSENKGLLEQNLKLLRERDANFLVSEDSLYTAEKEEFDTDTHKTTRTRLYDYSTANVVYNTIHRKHNYIIIDKGAEDGITNDMAVLSSRGIVGVVTDVSTHFSTVTSLLHPNSNISAKVMPADQLGTIAWEYGDPTSARLNDIPEHMSIHVGDSVFTSGFSDIFPSGLLIGVISEKSKSNESSFLTLKVKLATDFNHINTVFLVRNLYKEELEELKDNMEEDE